MTKVSFIEDVTYDENGVAFDPATGLPIDPVEPQAPGVLGGGPQLSFPKGVRYDATDNTKQKVAGKVIFQPVFGDKKFSAFSPKIEFKAFITAFRDEHSSKWDMSDLFVGTGKGITHRQGSQKRVLTFSLDVPAHSEFEARENLKNMTSLVQMMYPTRDKLGQPDRNTRDGMVQWKIDFANLIQDYVCVVESFAVVPNFDVGVYVISDTLICPKLYALDITAEYNPPNPNLFNGIDGNTIVFQQGANANMTYPYGLKSNLGDSIPDPSKMPIPQQDAPHKPTTEEGPEGEGVDPNLGNDSTNDTPGGAASGIPGYVLNPQGAPGPWRP
jgi:hypothetical protein